MSWSRQIWITCCTVSPSAGFWVSSAASSNNNITRNLPSFRHRRKQLCLHRRAGSSYTGTHQVCTSVCRWRRANSVCLISAACGTAIDHLPGLPGWSFTEWAEHWTLELWPYRGRVWRLLQQVLTQVLTYLRVHSTYMDATQTRYTQFAKSAHSLCKFWLVFCVTHSPQAEETSFHFDGSGYSVVQKSLRSTSTLIVLQFKTLSPVGLLLYLASNNTVRHTHLQSLLGFLFLRKHTHTSLSVIDRETSCPWSWWRGVFVWPLTLALVLWCWPPTGSTTLECGIKSHCRGTNAKVLLLLLVILVLLLPCPHC